MVKDTDSSPAAVDPSSLIQRIADLQAQLDAKHRAAPAEDAAPAGGEERLREMQATIDRLKAENQRAAERVTQLKKSEATKMQDAYDTVIKTWVKDCVHEKGDVSAHLKKCLEEAIKDAESSNGVWQLAMCASEKHREHLDKINRLSAELASRAAPQGSYDDEASRKRGAGEEEAESDDVWTQFAKRFRA
jgi:hypothetical protein